MHVNSSATAVNASEGWAAPEETRLPVFDRDRWSPRALALALLMLSYIELQSSTFAAVWLVIVGMTQMWLVQFCLPVPNFWLVQFWRLHFTNTQS